MVRRLRAHRLLVAAAALSVLLTTCVLAALTAFAASVGDAGLRRALQGADAAATPLVVTGSVGYPERAAADRTVREQARRAFAGLPVTVRSVASSGPYGLPAPPGTSADDTPDTTFAALDRGRLRLLRGAWPGPPRAGAPVPVAVPAAAERVLGTGGAAVAPGAVITLTDRLGRMPLRILVTGVYRARDVGDPYWQLDALGGKGTRTLVSRSYGPLLVQDAAFRSGVLPQYAVAWQAAADFGELTTGRTGAVTAGVQRSVAVLGAHPGFAARCDLPAVLRQVQRSVLVARSTLLVGLLQLAALAAATLLVAAGVLAERREGENALLRARGASTGRIAALAAAEAVLLALPAALTAPLLAGPLAGLLAAHGGTADAGLRLAGPLPPQVGWVAAAAAGGCALLVLAPALRRAAGGGTGRRPRRAVSPGLLRGGADLALVALAAAASWQLDRYASGAGGSGVLTTGAGGGLGVDPVLVAAPTLALCAGTVVALRLVPPAARLAERAAARSRGLPAALAGWRLSRRSLQGPGPVLLLALATAAGTLAIGQGAGWRRSQAEQAAFDTGGDVRVVAAGGPAFGQGGELAAVRGVAAAVPVARQSAVRGDDSAELLALDSRAERPSLPMRPDLADRPAPQLLALLAGGSGPAVRSGIPLPGRPRTLSLDVVAAFRPSGGGRAGRAAPVPSAARESLAVTLTDRHGVGYAMPLRTVPVDGRRHGITVDLRSAAGGTAGMPAYPLTLTGLTLDPPYAVHGPAEQTFEVRAVRADGVSAPVPAGLGWTASFTGNTDQAGPGTGFTTGSVRSVSAAPGAPLALRYDGGLLRPESLPFPGAAPPLGPTIRLLPAGFATPLPLPAVATREYLGSTRSRVGSVFDVPLGGGTVKVRIAAAVEALPGTGAAGRAGRGGPGAGPDGDGGPGDAAERPGGALLVDLGELDRRLVAAGSDAVYPSEWWLNLDPAADPARVAADLRGRPDVQTVQVRSEVSAALLHDPLGLGPQTALTAITAAAALLAAVGFAVGASGTVRRRADEDAVLSALGVRRRDLARAAAVELALPAVVGIGVGLVLGGVLTRAVVPLLVLTAQATRPLPPVLVDLPAGRLAVLTAAVAAVPLLVAAVAGRRVGDLARRLRRPEEP